MRELEFLPPWYPQLRRRRKTLFVQFWATIALAIGLMGWVAFTNRTIAQKQLQSSTLDRQLQQSRSDLKQLDAKLAEKKLLEQQQQVMARVGEHVEVTRLLAKLDQIMPKEMSLTQVSQDTQEQVKFADTKAGAKGAAAAAKTSSMSRKQVVHVTGVTPSDADWATVLAKLGDSAYFQNVQLEDAHEKTDQGHVMREFQVSFLVDLDDGE